MKIERTNIPGVLVYTPDIYEDGRGFFSEQLNSSYNFIPVQANMSLSKKGVIRGLHAQVDTAKLVWVASGSIFDVAYDPSTGNHFGIELSAKNHKQLLVDENLYHGFQALEDNTVVCYLMDNFYNQRTEVGISPLIIDWPIKEYIISKKDEGASNEAVIHL